MFEKAQVGDKVWSCMFGWGDIIHILDDFFPLRVRFETAEWSYSIAGCHHTTQRYPDLFWDAFHPPEEAKTPPVRTEKRWRWLVVQADANQPFCTITAAHYHAPKDVRIRWNAPIISIQKIEETEIEVEIK